MKNQKGKEPFKTKEEFEKALDSWLQSNIEKQARQVIRSKARWRALTFLRHRHQSEYQAYLNRFIDELTQEWKKKGGK